MAVNKDLISIELLKEISLFDGVPAKMLHKIFHLGKTRRCQAGANVVVEGQDGGKLHILVSGHAEVWKSVKGGLGQEQRLAKFERGAIFGEMSVFDGAPYSTTIKTVDDCQVHVIQGKDFKKFLKRNPETAYRIFCKLITLMSNRLRRTNLKLSLLDTD